ncbi:MAG: ATP-dependent Clp protease ATP-binding subunit [Clostridia bacterium]|nr:ATP-dependent Clp protease ATP-binding subunit [Clostridia bacterium]
MVDRFSVSAQRVLSNSLAFARELGHTYIGTEHILLAILNEKSSLAYKFLSSLGIKEEKTRQLIVEFAGKGERSADCVSDMTPLTKEVIEQSARIAEKEGESEVTTEIILFAIANTKSSTAVKLLSSQGCKVSDLCRILEEKRQSVSESSAPQAKKVRRFEERMPNLERFARNITLEAEQKAFDPVIGREAETERIMRILIRRTKNNPCLIGEPGVGKTAIVEGLASLIAEGNAPEQLDGVQIFALDLPSMLAGAKYRGDFEERMKLVTDEASRNPSIILFIDEIHTIIGAGSAEGAIDAANIIKPALARGKIKMIGATTLEEYRKHIEKDSAFERRFQPVTISEPSIEDSMRILYGLREKYEAHHKIKISDSAIEAAVKLSSTYINDRFLPDKAIDLIDESLARVQIEIKKERSIQKESEKVLRLAFCESAQSYDTQRSASSFLKSVSSDDDVRAIEKEDIARTVAEWTGIPLSKLDSENRILNLESVLKSRIFGQDEAIDKVVSALQRAKTCVRDISRPIATFLFTGPSGVGKTELAKALASALYNSESSLIRLDMSEYSEAHSISRIIGSPPGYVGYDDGGQLTEKVRRNPHHIILFDEIEKAHRNIFDLLLQVMDEGLLCDSRGRKVSFRNTVIIMTSNVGAQSGSSVQSRLGFIPSVSEQGKYVEGKLREVFSSEFLSRPDEIVIFRSLDYDSIFKISEKMLNELSSRIYENESISVSFDQSVARHIADIIRCEKSARDIRRAIISKVEGPLSLFMLTKGVSQCEHIRALCENGDILFYKEEKSTN